MVGTAIARPDEMLEIAADSLRETMAAPAFGPPRRGGAGPRRVRKRSRRALRAALPALEVTVADTPEIAAGRCRSRRVPRRGKPRIGGWLADGLPPTAVAGFFEAMAELWTAAPWKGADGGARS